MTLPTESHPLPSADVGWYYLSDGAQIGPVTEQKLLELAGQGSITPSTLVWQPGFNRRWKEAASIPMIAVHLGCFGQPQRRWAEASSRRADQNLKQVTEAAALSELERLTPADLADAVNDEEAADFMPDAHAVHEILERASRPPPERSIPPASVGTTMFPAPPVRTRRHARRLVIAVGSCVMSIGAVLLFSRWRSEAITPLRPAETPAEVKHADPGKPRAAANSATHERERIVEPPAVTDALPIQAAQTHELSTTAASANRASPVTITSGPLDQKSFETKLERALPMFAHQCWDRLRIPLDGVTDKPEVRVEIAVDRSGHVYDVTSSKAPRGYHGAGLCIIGRIRGWRFQRAEQGTRAVMTVPRIHP